MDYWALPPEVNSARMYAGAGATPLLSASAAWGALSAQVAETAAAVASTVGTLTAAWTGPSSIAMAHSANSYVMWLSGVSEQAAQTANQAAAAAAAFEAARAATVHPAVVFSNREQLAILNATNLLGQNTPAIMSLEALYAEYWAQDVAAMAAYQTTSAAATGALQPFQPAPQITRAATQTPTTQNPAGSVLQTLGGLLNPNGTPWIGLGNDTILGQYLQALVSSGPYEFPLTLLSLFSTLWAVSSPASPIAQALNNIAANATAAANAAPTAISAPTATSVASVRAAMGAAQRLGPLSAPPSWAQPPPTAPARAPTVSPLQPSETEVPLPIPLPLPVGARGGTPMKQPRPEPDYGPYTAKFVPRPHAGG